MRTPTEENIRRCSICGGWYVDRDERGACDRCSPHVSKQRGEESG